MLQKFKCIDMFGKPISFTFNYEETFQTLEGAIFTFLIFTAMIIIGGIYLSNVVNKTNQIVTMKIEYLDIIND